MNKDFLKEVLSNNKKLLELNEVRRVNVPMYDELSVVKLWPLMQDDAEFKSFFPSSMPKGRLPDRDYFFNILNTVQFDYL